MPSITPRQLAQVPHSRTLAGMAGAPLDDAALALPQTIAGLTLWLDASQIVGVADGASLGAWPDTSGNGYTAVPTQFKPIYRANRLGGMPAVDFQPNWSIVVPPNFLDSSYDKAFSLLLVEQLSNKTGQQGAITNAATGFQVQHVNSSYQTFTTPTGYFQPGYTQEPRIHILTFNGAQGTYSINGAEVVIAGSAAMGFSGALNIGGFGTAGSRWLGDIAEVAIWRRGLAISERQQLLAYAKAKYGFTHTKQLVIDGDSIAGGFTVATGGNQWCYRVATSLGASTWIVPNLAILGQTVAQIVTAGPTRADPLYDPSKQKNILICAAGTNDLKASVSTTTVYNNIVAYCQVRRATGFKVIVCTILPRDDSVPGSFETWRQTVNSQIIANWNTFADALADYGSDATIGVAGASDNLTYFNADKVHPNDAGHAIIAPYVTTAVNSL